MPQTDLHKKIDDIYRSLFACFGPQHWWPGETPFEVMVGAILTQSASWHNVEIAIDSLKKAGLLSPGRLREIPLSDLARYIHSSGYYNAKAKKLKALAAWLGKYSDNLEKAFAGNLNEKRNELLGIHGVGPETADSMLLYAAGKAAFVIDAYTKRIIERIGINPSKGSYEAYQQLFTSNLGQDTQLYNEYHALLVKLGKNVCRQKPICADCCLREKCEYGRKQG